LRIVAGAFRSRRLVAPKGPTRPTSDRARESLFGALGDVGGAACLDLFAGSGALALEALSRGAASATLVEVDPAALAAIRANVDALGVRDRIRVLPRDARRVLRDEAREGRRYDLLLIDPPYDALYDVLPVLDRHLAAIAAPGARVVVEAAAGSEIPLDGFDLGSRRRVGAAELFIFSKRPGADD
jgi:16S rRNA (guanine966-N2)-methyltransferase